MFIGGVMRFILIMIIVIMLNQIGLKFRLVMIGKIIGSVIISIVRLLKNMFRMIQVIRINSSVLYLFSFRDFRLLVKVLGMWVSVRNGLKICVLMMIRQSIVVIVMVLIRILGKWLNFSLLVIKVSIVIMKVLMFVVFIGVNILRQMLLMDIRIIEIKGSVLIDVFNFLVIDVIGFVGFFFGLKSVMLMIIRIKSVDNSKFGMMFVMKSLLIFFFVRIV